MRFSRWFMISPKSALLDRLPTADECWTDYFAERKLWSGEFHDRTGLEQQDFLLLTKLLFLSDILELDGLSSVFSGCELKISEEFFDAFWSVEEVVSDEDINQALNDSLQMGTFKQVVAASNDRLAQYLGSYEEWANARKLGPH